MSTRRPCSWYAQRYFKEGGNERGHEPQVLTIQTQYNAGDYRRRHHQATPTAEIAGRPRKPAARPREDKRERCC